MHVLGFLSLSFSLSRQRNDYSLETSPSSFKWQKFKFVHGLLRSVYQFLFFFFFAATANNFSHHSRRWQRLVFIPSIILKQHSVANRFSRTLSDSKPSHSIPRTTTRTSRTFITSDVRASDLNENQGRRKTIDTNI